MMDKIIYDKIYDFVKVLKFELENNINESSNFNVSFNNKGEILLKKSNEFSNILNEYCIKVQPLHRNQIEDFYNALHIVASNNEIFITLTPIYSVNNTTLSVKPYSFNEFFYGDMKNPQFKVFYGFDIVNGKLQIRGSIIDICPNGTLKAG